VSLKDLMVSVMFTMKEEQIYRYITDIGPKN